MEHFLITLFFTIFIATTLNIILKDLGSLILLGTYQQVLLLVMLSILMELMLKI